jgi:hypothetical protein
MEAIHSGKMGVGFSKCSGFFQCLNLLHYSNPFPYVILILEAIKKDYFSVFLFCFSGYMYKDYIFMVLY